jgi:hypothetical protein
MTVGLPVNVASVVFVPKGSVPGNTVRVDGRDVAGVEEAGYLRVPVGSGTHTIVRVVGR